jgi:putative ABC transport system permease protein
MALTHRLPLAVQQLRNSPLKTLSAVAGMGFSNVLVFFQLGLLDSTYQSQERPYSLLDGEIVLVSSRFSRLSQAPLISKPDVLRAQGLEGVAKVSTLQIASENILVRKSGFTTQAQIYAIDPQNPALNLVRTDINLAKTNLFERAAIDVLSRPAYLKQVEQEQLAGRDYQTNLGSRRLLINSTARIGSTFASDLSLVMSTSNFNYYFPSRQSYLVSLGVVKLEDGYSTKRVLRSLQERLYPEGSHIQAITVTQASLKELEYWKNNTSLTFIFGLGVVVGFIISGIILYQLLYADVISHLSEYATLVAIGYSNAYVMSVVFGQALVLSTIAFPFSLGVSTGIYAIMSTGTNLVISMTLPRAALVLLVSSVTSVVSCFLATSQLRKVDPSTLY